MKPWRAAWTALIIGVVLIAGAPAAGAAAALRVRGNALVDGPGRGHIVQLRGVNRSGLEYACIQGWGFFDSPHPDQIDDPAMIRAMLSWNINVVRIPLNEDCWLGIGTPGGRGGAPAYRAAGMQQLVDAVRSTGADQPLMIGGLDYAADLRGWLAHAPNDPRHQIVADEHNYGVLAPCSGACRSAILATHRRVPVVFGELGETDCQQAYIDRMMPWADRHGISYVGWAWNVASCTEEPALISDYRGTPTAFGAGFQAHLRALGPPAKPQ